ncbi:MAG: reverse transcriptase domain-containing protein [Deltaproteobacteria bacterium]|nr:reverse transcriptase domain-containing protein [Deltaproteobacteria bacterium]
MDDADIFSLRNLYRAYLNCRQSKRGSRSALQFELHAEGNLIILQKELKSRTYSPLPSTCFVTESPKPREIFAAHFRDRIVHHLLVSQMEPGWERRFIHDSYACRKGKGNHAAVTRLQEFMLKVSNNRSRPAFFMHLDVRSFFVSIDKQILYDIVCRREKRPEIIWLMGVVIFNNPAEDPIKKGQMSLFEQIPRHKSLFHTGGRTGLPIGNYTSQFFANVYLNELDQFVKHTLKCRYYLRYVDDLVLLGNDIRVLQDWELKIGEFIATRLRLELNMNTRRVASIHNGCNFLGYIVRPTHLAVRNRMVNNLKSKIIQYQSKLACRWNNTVVYKHEEKQMVKLHSVLASYLGQFNHAATHRLICFLFQRYWVLSRYFAINGKVLRRLDQPPRFHNLAGQYRWFCRRYFQSIIFFQVGRYFEFYGRLGKFARNVFHLRPGTPRPRLGIRVGFPVARLSVYLRMALAISPQVLLIKQTGRYSGNVMERRVHLSFTR